MLLTAILLVFSAPQSANTAKAESNTPAAVFEFSSNDSSLSQPLPAAPEPKIAADVDAATGGTGAGSVASAAIESRYTPSAPMSISPARALMGRPYETSRQRKLWYALSLTGAGAASFDAWSTRRAISRGYGTEGNPMLRPFSHSGVLYAATQVSPLVMDFVGKRMMVSRHSILRKAWWLPQAVGSGVSVSAAVHNVRMVP
jgi:hypothetical protein